MESRISAPAAFKSLLLLIPALLLFSFLELAAHVYEAWRPSIPIDLDAGFAQSARAFLPAGPGSAFVRTNPSRLNVMMAQTFQARKPPGRLRIVALGESSVFRLQGNFFQLASRLTADLGGPEVEIINAGAQSYGSERLAILSRELASYEPDVVFIYIGHNEFEEVEQFRLVRPALGPAFGLFYRSALVRVGSSLLLRAHIQRLEREHAERLASSRPDTARAWAATFTAEEVAERMRYFQSNLELILDLFQKQGVPVLLSTIPSNLLRPVLSPKDSERFEVVRAKIARGEWREAHELGRRILREAGGRHQSSDLENSILRQLAESRRLPLVDVEAAVARAEPHHLPGETLFEDHCHLNERGNKILVEELHRELVALLKKNRARTAAAVPLGGLRWSSSAKVCFNIHGNIRNR